MQHPPTCLALPLRLAARLAVIFFGNKLSLQTQIGTAVAIFGTWL